ncbi:Ninja-family protein AFP2 [Forsythia ovata]|uniref:Ninja-family protein n=1 Tax=Forsythia ovata TaxID=205694 RepID=A0ABD1TBH4_9LAMI
MGNDDDRKKIIRTAEMRNFSSNRSSSRDLLQRFVGSSSEWEEVKEEEEIELNLGLSLGGRFGVDKGSKKLVRSSSIAECLPVVRDDNDVVPPVAYTGLEKREIEVNLRERLDKEKFLAAAKKLDSSIAPPFRLSMWATATAGGAVFRDGIEEFGQLASQGSVESKGWSSLSVSELDCKTLQGSSSGGEFSPASIQPLQEGSNHNVGSYGTKARENRSRKTGSDMESPSKRPDITRNPGTETGMNVMQDMPCVFTKGDGPNGRKVEGILYKYGKGEEVKIMCICHGSFLSPAEFVKHAGVSDVDQPLKHIVVNPNASSLL